MQDAKPAQTPMEQGLRLVKRLKPIEEQNDDGARHEPYREAVGCLIYLSQTTRPSANSARIPPRVTGLRLSEYSATSKAATSSNYVSTVADENRSKVLRTPTGVDAQIAGSPPPDTFLLLLEQLCPGTAENSLPSRSQQRRQNTCHVLPLARR